MVMAGGDDPIKKVVRVCPTGGYFADIMESTRLTRSGLAWKRAPGICEPCARQQRARVCHPMTTCRPAGWLLAWKCLIWGFGDAMPAMRS